MCSDWAEWGQVDFLQRRILMGSLLADRRGEWTGTEQKLAVCYADLDRKVAGAPLQWRWLWTLF